MSDPQNQGFVHKHVINQLEAKWSSLDWETEKEFQVEVNGTPYFVDLAVEKDSHVVLIEVETSTNRIFNDCLKHGAISEQRPELKKNCLWIVAPNKRVQTAIRRKLKRLDIRERLPRIAVFSLPSAKTAAEKYHDLWQL